MACCILCGTITVPKKRSVVNSDTNTNLIPLLALLIERALTAEGISCHSTETLQSLYNNKLFLSNKCHTKLSHYYDTDISLLEKLRNNITLKEYFNNETTNYDVQTTAGNKRVRQHSSDLGEITSSSKRSRQSTSISKHNPDT